MEGYGYPFPPQFGPMLPHEGDYPDHGDGFGEYYGLGPLNEDLGRRPSRSKHRTRKNRDTKRSRNSSGSKSRSRSRSRSKPRSQSKSRSLTRSRSRSGDRQRELSLKEPGFLDAFRVLYLTPSKHKKNTTKYLATKNRQDRVQEILKSDGLGSKRWLFYPRSVNAINCSDPAVVEVGSRDTCDQRIKIDGDFFRKYKKSKKVDSDSPIMKLKRWELLFYKKLGFIQAV